MTPIDHLVCHCMAVDTATRLQAWRKRATPTMQRLGRRGRAVDPRHIVSVLGLVAAIEYGRAEAFSAANWHRSHHMRDCPCSGRQTPLAQVAFNPKGPVWASLP